MKHLKNLPKEILVWCALLTMFSNYSYAEDVDDLASDDLRTTLLISHKEELLEYTKMLKVATNAIDSATAYNNMSVVHLKASYYLKSPQYDSINHYSDKAINLTQHTQSKESIKQYLIAAGLKGTAYKDLGDLTKALDYFYIIIAATENVSNPSYFFYRRQAATTGIAGIYAIQNNYELALAQYDCLFKYVKKKKIDTSFLSSIVYLRYARFSRELGRMDIAMENANKAIAIAKRNAAPYREAMAYLELAHIYINKEKDTQATSFLEKAFKILNSDKKYVGLLSKYYYLKALLNKKNTPIAEKIYNAEKAYKLLVKETVSDRHIATGHLLYDVYKEIGFFQKANAVLEKTVSFEKVISNTKEIEKGALLEIQRRDKNIELFEAENKKQDYVIFFIFFLLTMTASGAFYIYTDRIKKIKLANEIAIQNKELEELNKIKSHFFSNISHELQTPLTLISGPLEQALNDNNNVLDIATKSKLQMAMKNTKSLRTLVNDILDLSKLKAKKLTLNTQSTDLDTFFNTKMQKFIPLMKQKEISFHYCFKKLDTVHVIIDTKKLEKVLNNLLSNAIKYTPANGIISVTGYLNTKEELEFSVKDTGIGISNTDLPFIFDRYFQSKDTSKPLEGGYGIGLSLVKEIITLMHGTISVESELGNGSEFKVQMPIKKANREASKIYQKDTVLSIETPLDDLLKNIGVKTQQHTVLIVEDHPGMQQFLVSILQNNYKLLIADNGKEALRLLDLHDIDLIVSDVMMPVMDGFTLLETLKSSKLHFSIPIIMLTALSEINYKLKALTIGVDDYLTKPFAPSELLARTHNLIQRYIIRKEVHVENQVASDVEEKLLTTDFVETSKLVKVTKSDTELIAKVADIIKQNIDNPNFKLNDLTEKLYLSERQLRRKIKLITGLSPKKFQQEILLTKARTLLENGTYSSVKAVAISVGVHNTTRFRQLYQSRFGKNPSTYF